MIQHRSDRPLSRALALCLDLTAPGIFNLPARDRESALVGSDAPKTLGDQLSRLFDMVLMCDALVPLVGFEAKSLVKLVAGFAPVVRAQSDGVEGAGRDPAARLETLWRAGCRRTIFVSSGGQPDASAPMLIDLARSFDFDVQLLPWRQLIKAGVAVGHA